MSFNKVLKTSLVSMAVAATTSVLAYDVSSMSWSEIEAQAKKEGKVNFAVWYLQPGWREFVKDFESEYGIKVRIPEGTADGNRNKLIAESKLEKGKMDLVALGAAHVQLFDLEKTLMPLDKLPDYKRLKTVSEGFDSRGYAVTFWGNQSGIAYDPTRINESELPQDFEQLSNYIVKHPNEFGVNDPNGGGSGGRFIEAALRNFSLQYEGETLDQDSPQWKNTWNWFNQYKESITITGSNADSITRINDGELVLAPAWEDHLAGLQKRGAITDRLKFYIPKFGMSGGANFVSIAKNAKNPAASLVFLNWLTSAEAQTKLNAKFGVAPQHPDADDSAALVPQNMRQYSTTPLNVFYEKEVKKQFVQKVLMN